MNLHPAWPAWMPIHPHLLFELLAFSLGFQVFRAMRKTQGDPVHSLLTRIWLVAAAAAGGAFGAKVLVLFADPWSTWSRWTDLVGLLSGRTIVGALLGGWEGGELAKGVLRVGVATGDLYVVPLCVGMALGRVGCFFSGVSDGTHGAVTSMPWGMDLGDGLPRHPTALYEIVVLIGLGGALARWIPATPGDRFRVFLAGYLVWRLGIETLKPQPTPYWGLSAIQLACVAGVAAILWGRISRRRVLPARGDPPA